MRKTLLMAAAVSFIAAAVPAQAAVITDLGLDPTSAGGHFSNSLGSLVGGFDDQYTFTLDHVMTLTIASVTNVFASPTDFISGFTGEVVEGTPPPGTLGNVVVIGPVAATLGCGPITNCQGFAGSAILGAGSYFLDISGNAEGSSGYGGNLATFAAATPLPAAAWLFAGGLGILGFVGCRRKSSPVSAFTEVAA